MNIEDNHTILYSLLSHIFYECVVATRESDAFAFMAIQLLPPISEKEGRLNNPLIPYKPSIYFRRKRYTYSSSMVPVKTACRLGLDVDSKITNHRKLKAKWKDIRTLEYTDSTTGTKVTLSDDINEFMAIVSFKNHLQNESGLVSRNPVDITQYSREDFLRYYNSVYDPENPTQYEQVLAQAAKKHEGEMKILAARTLPVQ